MISIVPVYLRGHGGSACDHFPCCTGPQSTYGWQPDWNALSYILAVSVITGRNEVVAKVIFLHLSVILFTGGHVCGRTPPSQTPRQQTNPRSIHPSGSRPLPGSRPLGSRHPPPQTRHHPPRKQTPAYGQRAAGMHPTGMHSCVKLKTLCYRNCNRAMISGHFRCQKVKCKLFFNEIITMCFRWQKVKPKFYV